jgi:hypothetical protein
VATSVNTSLPQWLAGCTYDANGGNDLRNSGITALVYDTGIVTGSTIGVRGGVMGGAGLAVNPGTGMTVTVQPGSFVVPNSGTPTAGGYTATLVSQATLTVQTADPSNPRIDIVVANVVDNGNSTSFGQVQIITGVAAPSPSAPSAPANSITLCQLTVTAGASAITSGMLSDVRPFTTATGGILIAPLGTVTGYTGQIAYDKASGRFYHNNNASNATQLHVLPWEPVIATSASPITVSGTTNTTVLSTTVTCDGYTDIEIFFKWPGVNSTAGSGVSYSMLFNMYIDSANVDGLYSAGLTGDGYTQGGGAWSYYTNSANGNTPSAGTHTVTVKAQLHKTTSISAQISGFTANNIILRVEPVGM